MRKTSREAYEKNTASGLLSKRRLQAYSVLYAHGPMTGSELCKVAGCPGLWKRLSELREGGLVTEQGEKTCDVTGERAIAWVTTDLILSGALPKMGWRAPKKRKREPVDPDLIVDRAQVAAEQMFLNMPPDARTAELARLKKENDYLRGLIPQLKEECIYCGLKEMAKCKSGFPGCGLADDIFCAQEGTLSRLRTEVRILQAKLARKQMPSP